jgi:predicted alpha/beta-fold hydrolase
MKLRKTAAELAGHGWTVGSWLRHKVRPRSAPAWVPWSTVLDDPKVGAVRLSGALRHRETDDLLLVVHGMGGETDAAYGIDAALAAEAAGFACLRLSLRGADRKGEDYYHAGLTADLHAALASSEIARYRRVFVLGYSLGGHVTLRFALDAPSEKVVAVAAVSAPLDLDLASRWFDRPALDLYRRNMLGGLYEIYESVARRRQVPTPVAVARKIRKIREWDTQIVAPRFGFRDAEHYYHSVSVAPWLPEMRLPALLVYARHDPIVPEQVVANALGQVGTKTLVRWHDRGGHMGFPLHVDLGLGPNKGLEQQILGWFTKL